MQKIGYRDRIKLKYCLFIFIIFLFTSQCSAQISNGNFSLNNGVFHNTEWDYWTNYSEIEGAPYATAVDYNYNIGKVGDGFYVSPKLRGNDAEETFVVAGSHQNVDFTGYGNLSFWYKDNEQQATTAERKVLIGATEYVLPTVGSTWTYHTIDVSSYEGTNQLKLYSRVGVTTKYAAYSLSSLYIDEMVLTDYNPTLSGYVKNNLENTVSAATITLSGLGGSTTSNDTGYYEITNIPTGTYTITATSPTHEDYSDTISITGNTEKNITMMRLSPVLTWTDAETTMNDVFLKWRRNIVVDNVRIYKDTETRLLTTVSSGSTLAGLYSDRNLDCDKGYVYWLQPMDNDVAGPKYRIDAKTDPCDGGGGGGGDPTPTPSPTATPGPTPPPWTNITQEEWLNLTLDQKQEILANMSLFPPLLEFQWEDIYVWGIHLFLILCGAVALDSVTIQKVSEYTGLWAILPGVMFAYLTGYLVI